MNEYDRTRQMVDLSVSCGRKLQSSQTGYVHWYRQMGEEDRNDTIPIYENILFCLALIRSHTVEGMSEGRKILEKLLHFQVSGKPKDQGNFPSYLHEFPTCYDSFLSTKLLPPFYWLLQQEKVLGAALMETLRQVIEQSIAHAERVQKEKELPFPIEMKLVTGQIAFGQLWKQKERVKAGEKRLEELCEQSLQSDFGSWFSPEYIGDILTALQIIYPKGLTQTPWKHFWEHIEKTWDNNTRSYCGPSIQDRQWKLEPMSTLYDLYVGHTAGCYNYRSFRVHPFQLQGACVHEMHEYLKETLPVEHKGDVGGYDWHLKKTEGYALSLMEKKGKLTPELEKGFQPLRLLWGDHNHTHSFVCQGGNVSHFGYSLNGEEVELLIDVDGPVEGDDKEKSRELAFFCSKLEGVVITVNGKRATTFTLGDELVVIGQGIRIVFTVRLVEGDGRFVGHIHPGNRPSQRARHGKYRFSAFDWSIFLRTVRRETSCKFSVSVRIEAVPEREALSPPPEPS